MNIVLHEMQDSTGYKNLTRCCQGCPAGKNGTSVSIQTDHIGHPLWSVVSGANILRQSR